MITNITITHHSIEFENTYEVFVSNLSNLLGRIERTDFNQVISDPDRAFKHLSTLGGSQNLILFGTQDHGDLLNLVAKRRKASQYLIGNPLTALEMTKHDIRAALYAPLRVLVFENDAKKVTVEYDLPSDLFGQFGNPHVLKVARELDDKLYELLQQASKNAI